MPWDAPYCFMRRMDESWRNRLREAVEGDGRSWAKLSQAAGQSPTYARDMLSPTPAKQATTPKITTFMEFCRILGVDAWEILTGERHDEARAPIISWVSAGQLHEAVDLSAAHEGHTIPVGGLGNGEYFGLTVSGDSMNRVSPEGSIIIVDANDRELQAGQPYIFSIRGEATYKRWQPSPPRLEPDSWLPHDTIFLDGTNAMFVVGRVRRTMLDL